MIFSLKKVDDLRARGKRNHKFRALDYRLDTMIVTDKRIRDRTIISSIKSKFDDRFFVYLRVLYKFEPERILTVPVLQIKTKTISPLKVKN